MGAEYGILAGLLAAMLMWPAGTIVALWLWNWRRPRRRLHELEQAVWRSASDDMELRRLREELHRPASEPLDPQDSQDSQGDDPAAW